ncbi:UvrB/UvrC motif-containing protein [Blastopirellula sp. JC732]|uniref:UvrB/UvrC motif-containing protein n=1 Tax=Blastopirellula sediminis TaxID=2894196 RepID=A0A9X1MRD3_9BACT|nr:UvrB/UvrC motif-containing protein [Blastopirellula sediminis]MCC9604728.1 UvrB/UvrC motif-containing protein [Blastopirellula sediminis]MCC9631973.1 UvrB/UvrC motif-containing protein [Blastopirellula sediminis]
MENPEHIDFILNDWPFENGHLSARIVSGEDGRDVVQMRIEMGLMQMEVDGRPDGTEPFGFATYADYLQQRIDEDPDYTLTDGDCSEIDREFIQFYHRRICWLGLREYQRAVRDADQTLLLMDICRDHSDDDEWVDSHEQFRPFVLFHRIQAAALATLTDLTPERAIEVINLGLEEMREVFIDFELEEEYENDELVKRLIELREQLRSQYEVGQTLQEQLAEAVAREEYERAAQIRDRISKRER